MHSVLTAAANPQRPDSTLFIDNLGPEVTLNVFGCPLAVPAHSLLRLELQHQSMLQVDARQFPMGEGRFLLPVGGHRPYLEDFRAYGKAGPAPQPVHREPADFIQAKTDFAFEPFPAKLPGVTKVCSRLSANPP